MKRARSFPTTHLGLAAFVWAVLMLAPPRAAAQCINLGGNWTYSESGTVLWWAAQATAKPSMKLIR